MFSKIDNEHGRVRLAYSGVEFATTNIPDHRVVNTEHVWPQSRFADAQRRQQIKTDLHHLLPVYSRINNERGNNPYAEIPDALTTEWWISPEPHEAAPAAEVRDQYSESASGVFEPREDSRPASPR